MKSLYQTLEEYRKSDYYGFHMPGHKRNETLLDAALPYGLDITEIEGFDDLHHADGILKQAEERAARLYHAEETHFLVNGSTVGILSAILGCTKKGDKILVARNCHKSVYHAIYMNELYPVYLYPNQDNGLHINGELKVSDVENALKDNPDVKAVMIVSPTYDGVLSDVKKIAEVVHAYRIPLIVDEAHGAHFGFHPYFPQNANEKGADVVIHSVHKTLPAFTQTALVHLNGTIINRRNIRKYLHMLQSSSPSYLLMASIDQCMEFLEAGGAGAFAEYVQNIDVLREHLKELKHLEILTTEDFDRSKFVISVKNTEITSREIYELLLEEYHLQMEMVSGTYVLAMTTVGDTEEGLDRLEAALKEMDAKLTEAKENAGADIKLPKLTMKYTSAQMEEREAETDCVPWDEAAGYVAAEYAYVYPPGIPLIVPGEVITEEAVRILEKYESLSFQIEGLEEDKHIGVWKNG